jgi:hypothetical protein
MFSGDPLLNAAGMTPTLDGRTPVFVELGADPRVSPGFDAPRGSIARFGTSYFTKANNTPATAWERLATGAFGWADYWLTRQLAFVDRFLGVSDNKWVIHREMENAPTDEWTVTTTLTGAVTQATTGAVRGGIYELSSGVTANSTATIHTRGAIPWLSGGSAEKWALATRLRRESVTDANMLAQWGVAQLGGTFESHIGIAGATGNWTLNNNATSADSGVLSDAADFHNLLMINDGTNLRLFLDAVQVALLASSIAAQPLMVRHFLTNGATASNRAFRTDKIALIGLDVNE